MEGIKRIKEDKKENEKNDEINDSLFAVDQIYNDNNNWRKRYGRGEERRKKWRWKKEKRGNPELGSKEDSTVEQSAVE